MNPPTPPKRITEWKMRWLFRRHRFLARVKSGELMQRITRNTHPSRTAACEPFCTLTQEISYDNPDGQEQARVHQYLRTDGTIGAWGLPDPKRLKIGTRIYAMHKRDARVPLHEQAEAWALKYILRVWG
jgi:hypothetical protein